MKGSPIKEMEDVIIYKGNEQNKVCGDGFWGFQNREQKTILKENKFIDMSAHTKHLV